MTISKSDKNISIINAIRSYFRCLQMDIPIGQESASAINYENYDDSLRVDILDAMLRRGRTNSLTEDTIFQVSIFCKPASRRADENVYAREKMADLVQDCCQRKCIPVMNWSTNPEEPEQIGILRTHEGMEKYIVQRTVGGVQGASVSSPKSGINSVIITYNAKMETIS